LVNIIITDLTLGRELQLDLKAGLGEDNTVQAKEKKAY
jgi:hypothetical protein